MDGFRVSTPRQDLDGEYRPGAMADIEGVLFDIDGVLLTSWQPIEGAGEAVREVRRRGLACRVSDQHHFAQFVAHRAGGCATPVSRSRRAR